MYKTIYSVYILFTEINKKEYDFLYFILKNYSGKCEWTKFAAFWNGAYNQYEIENSCLIDVCQDLEARLGLEQGKLSSENLGNLNLTVKDAIDMLRDIFPDWMLGSKCHNWKNHVPDEVRNIWHTFDGFQRSILKEWAEELASREEWD